MRISIAIGEETVGRETAVVRIIPRGPIPPREGTHRNTERAPRRFTIINCGVARVCIRVYVYTYRGSMVLL